MPRGNILLKTVQQFFPGFITAPIFLFNKNLFLYNVIYNDLVFLAKKNGGIYECIVYNFAFPFRANGKRPEFLGRHFKSLIYNIVVLLQWPSLYELASPTRTTIPLISTRRYTKQRSMKMRTYNTLYSQSPPRITMNVSVQHFLRRISYFSFPKPSYIVAGIYCLCERDKGGDIAYYCWQNLRCCWLAFTFQKIKFTQPRISVDWVLWQSWKVIEITGNDKWFRIMALHIKEKI